MQTKNNAQNIESALNRLVWRFKNQNVKINESKIIVNEKDIEAIDFLIEWINNQKKESIQENLLFAKMYCYALSNEIEFYKDIKFSNYKLQNELQKPIKDHYNKISNSLNRLELDKFLQSKGIIIDHIESMGLTQEKENEQELLKKECLKESQKYIIGIWDAKKVYASLNNQITECINRFKNLK